MVLIRKDVLKPGVYHKGGRSYTITRDDLNAFVSNFHEMKTANLRVPVPWEHPKSNDAEAYPAHLAEEIERRERARLNSGWVSNLFLEGDVLMMEADLRKEDAEKLEEIGGFVSPHFGTFRDGRGKEWKGAIAHVALTNRPVVADQSNKFEMVQFSLADIEGDSMADDANEDPTKAEETESSLPEVPAEEGPKDLWPEIRSELAALGIMVPDTVTITGDLDALLAAIASSRASRNSEKQETESNTDPEKPSDEPIREEESNTVSMSIESLQGQVTALTNELTKSRRAGLVSRVDSLLKSGRIAGNEAELLKNAAGSYQFSQADEGKSELEVKLGVYEELPEGTFWTDAEKVAAFSVKEHQEGSFFNGDGDISDERAEQIAKELQP